MAGMARALWLIRLSAEQGFFQAQMLLSGFYRSGLVVQQDAGLAAYWRGRADQNVVGKSEFDFIIP